MAVITWSPRMSVGNDTLDRDHQILVERVNRFHDVIKGNLGRESLPQLFADLMTYTDYHFQTEERLMKLAGFPEYDAHHAMHEGLKTRLAQFEAQYAADPLRFPVLTMFDFLSDWLMRHILREDMKVGAALRAARTPPQDSAEPESLPTNSD